MGIINTYLEFNIHGTLNLASGYLNFLLGVFILFKNPRSKINQSFFIVTLTSLLWLNGMGLYSLIKPLNLALFLSSTAYLGVPFISPSVYLFSCAWRKQKENYKWAYIGFLLGIPLMIRWTFYYESLFYPTFHWWGKYMVIKNTTFNVIYEIFLISHFCLFGCLAFRNFIRGLKESKSKSEKLQFRNILISYAIAYTGSIDFLTAWNFDVYPFGCISISIYIFVVAYTIVRHQFLEINLVIKRLSALLFIYISLLLVLIPISFPILKIILDQPEGSVQSLMFLFSIMFGIFFSLGPIIYAYLVKHSFWLRGHMTTGLTHELKSPLSSIQSATDIISTQLENPESSKEKISEYLGMIRANSSRLEKSVKDLLDISKIQDGKVEINRTNFELKPMLNELKAAYMPLILKKSLNLTIDTNNVTQVYADEEKIKQVVSNLLSNAIKFSENGEIRVEFKKEGDQIVGYVSDQGRGIEKTDLPRIFDRFYQGRNAVKGSGVGLTIARAWVEAHAGTLKINSDSKSKTIATFTLKNY